MLIVGLFLLPVAMQAQTTYKAFLSGYNETTPNASSATGEITLTLDGTQLTVEGSFSGLESDYNTNVGSHIHAGAAGTDGGVAISLDPSLDADNRGGTYQASNNTFTLTADQVSAMEAGNLYVNIHSVDIPSGEIRGQIYLESNTAPGVTDITVPADGAALTVAGFPSTPFVPEWTASADSENDPLYVWQLAADDAFTTLLLTASAGTEEQFNADFQAVDDILAGAGVEVGQTITVYHRAIATDGSNVTVGNSASVELTRGEVAVEEYTALLSGLNEVPAVDSPGEGEVTVNLDVNEITVQGTFSGLGSAFNTNVGAHIHLGYAGSNGGVEVPLNPEVDADGLGGVFGVSENTFTLTDTQVEAMQRGQLYVNIHTVDKPSGELRGQILMADNAAPGTTEITSPADGATLTIEGDLSTPFAAEWAGTTDTDMNDTVRYVWQLSASDSFESLLVNASVGTETQFVTDFETVDAILESAGVEVGQTIPVYHRAVATDGSNVTAGNASTVTLTRGVVEEPTAQVQVIHNAADPAAERVDVYINGDLTLDNFEFRSATNYVDLPANTPVFVGIADSASSSAEDIMVEYEFNLEANENYHLIANGVLSPGNFAGDAEMIGFDLFAFQGIESEAATSEEVYLTVIHGATDAPAVDVYIRGIDEPVIDALAYGDASSTLSVDPTEYELEVALDITDATAAAFDADLSNAGGASIAIFASGFYDVAANQFGPQFGLMAVFADGTTAMLPAKTAQVQVIHNAADPAAATVDGYVNGALALDDFAFRTATGYLELPAYMPNYVGIAGSGSQNVSDTLVTFGYNLPEDGVFQLIANGVLDPSSFEENPDEESTAFNLFVGSSSRTASSDMGEVDFRVFHGATDAPAVDVTLRGGDVLVPNAAYGDLTDYLTVPAGAYGLAVLPAGATDTVAIFNADLSGLGGGAATVLASGFLSPDNDQNGEAFTLIAVLPDGTVVNFDAVGTSTEELAELPSEFRLKGNYPNPFNPTTNIAFSLPASADLKVEVFNILGQKVLTNQYNGFAAGANQTVQIDAAGLNSGVYLYRVTAQTADQTFVDTGRMTLVK